MNASKVAVVHRFNLEKLAVNLTKAYFLSRLLANLIHLGGVRDVGLNLVSLVVASNYQYKTLYPKEA